MKLSNDIKAVIEADVKNLTEAFLAGEISPTRPLVDYFTPQELEHLSKEIIRYQLDKRLLSCVIPYLSTMKWLTFVEACIYSRKSRNTLLSLIETGKIYGMKPDGAGEYVIDRESIDAYYNALREERVIHISKMRRGAGK